MEISYIISASLQDWLNGNWQKATLDPIIALTGDGLFALFVGGGLLFSFYLAGRGDLAAPVSLLMIFSSLMVPMMPASMHGVAYTISLVGLAGSLIAVARRYVMEP